MPELTLAEAVPTFHWADWGVVGLYLVLTTILGAKLAGRQATVRDFFLGGRKLPWWAICGSTIATEISTATFVAVPAVSFAAGGNLTYLQLAIGSIIARIIVALYFVPKYFEKEIYSPYDYAGYRLGARVKKATTALFMIGAVLGQGARLYTSGFVLSTVAGVDLITAVWLMGIFSVLWAMIGGITMVIWTDVIQFFVLLLGAMAVLWYSFSSVPASWGDMLQIAQDADKFRLFDFSFDMSLNYTFWVGILCTPFINLAAFGTDQVMTQRMFCCRNQRDAAKATIVSSVSIFIALLMLLVGVALYVYFRFLPFTPEEAALFDERKTYLLPIFIVRALPMGIRGLVVAAIFAAAVSTLESALAALAQTTSSPLLKRIAPPKKKGRKSRKSAFWQSEVAVSKMLVFGWGVVLCIMASACRLLESRFENTIDLVLAMSGYTMGPLLGIFLLAMLSKPPSDAGLPWAVPLAVLGVFGVLQHDWNIPLLGGASADLTDWIVWGGCLAALVLALKHLHGDVLKVGAIAAAVIVIVLLHAWNLGLDGEGSTKYPSYTWSYAVGPLITMGLGYVLGGRKSATPQKA